jgi:DNA-binding transcriptional regulator YiaG
MKDPLPHKKTTRPDADVVPLSSSVYLSGQVEIRGKRFLTRSRISLLLGISERTLRRWGALRIGPPNIKFFKIILYDEEKLLGWLANNEIESIRARSRRQ